MRKRNNSFSSASEVFGVGTDLAISLFAMMTCLFAFVIAKNFDLEGELNSITESIAGDHDRTLKVSAQLKVLMEQAEQAKQKEEILLEKNRSLQEIHDKTVRELAEASRKYAELIVERDEHKSALAQLLIDHQSLKGDLERSNAQLSDAIDKLAIAHEDFKTEKMEAEKKILQLTQSLTMAEDKYSVMLANNLNAQYKLTLLRDQLTTAEKEIADLTRAVKGVISLHGRMKNVVFIFDTSGSMVDRNSKGEIISTQRFDNAKDLLKRWINSFPFEAFAVVRFSTTVASWPEGRELRPNAAQSRSESDKLIDKFTAEGYTATRAALEAGFSYNQVDTVVLFTDGEPLSKDSSPSDSPREMRSIINWLKKEHPEVVINTVAIGQRYFDSEYGPFLQEIAENHKGTFLGR